MRGKQLKEKSQVLLSDAKEGEILRCVALFLGFGELVSRKKLIKEGATFRVALLPHCNIFVL
jgi:hypothetical protein